MRATERSRVSSLAFMPSFSTCAGQGSKKCTLGFMAAPAMAAVLLS